jgi:hypothetical protein
MERSYFLYLLLFIMMSGVAANNVTFAPPPNITNTTLFQFTNSSQDDRLIWSPQLEILNLKNYTIANGSVYTNATLTVFNRSAPMNYSSRYEITLNGNWTHVESSTKSLSCSVLY